VADINAEEPNMRVREVMTQDVLSIGPDAPIREVARLLVEHRISGVPVCDTQDTVLGVVSEADILYKEHDPDEGHLRGPLGWIVDGIPDPARTAKAAASTAGEAMTAPAVTIAQYTSVPEAARIMSERGVNRLPVVKDGKLVGIVTRADLVRAFTRSDDQIATELREDVLGRTLWLEPDEIIVSVVDGVVGLSGQLRRKSDVELLVRLAERVPGVAAVESTVGWETDDTTRKARRAVTGAAR
jgi:CBS domain-containing protein